MADDDAEDADFGADKDEPEDEVEVDDLETDAAADDDDDAAVEVEEDAEETTEAEPAVAARAEGGAPRADSAVVHSPAAKEAARQRLASDVEAFLKRGGSIESVPQDVRADPPKKPESNYGRGSI